MGASSVVVSGTPLVRPRGQLQADNDDPDKGSVYGPSRLLDMELEMGLFVGGLPPQLGRPITMEEAEEYIFGLVLMNDWSARDIQKWEYVPLGPFGAKNFGTTISPWVVTLDALEPFRCQTSAGTQDPVPLEYLRDPNYGSYDVSLEVDHITPENSVTTICKSNFRHMYWNVKQQLVHHSITGCNMKPGDLLGSGTISGTSPGSYGSMLELTWRGRDEIKLSDGGVRKFLQDHDTLNVRGFCAKDGEGRIGFGDCSGKILPAGSYDNVAVEQPVQQAGFTDFELHGYWRSSASWRVRVALAYHNIDFTTKPVHLLKDGGEQLKSDFTSDVNPMAQVPALSFKDSSGRSHILTRSLAIIEFLDSIAGPASPALVPRGEGSDAALRRGQALQIAQVINSGIQPLQNLNVFKAIKVAVDPVDGGDVDGKAYAAAKMRQGLEACEQLVKQSAGRFAVGNEVTIADLCIVPQLYSAKRFDIDPSDYPTLQRIAAACQELPCFAAGRPEVQPDAET